MKFWAWYLEQTAALLGEEGYRFPKKEIRRFQEQQEPPRPVPEQADLETLSGIWGWGNYCTVPGRHGITAMWSGLSSAP